MQNEERNKQERLAIQGKYNLAMGIQLAREDFEREIEEIAQDDSLPTMPPEKVERFFTMIHAEQARIRAQKLRKAVRKKFIQLGVTAAVILIFVPAIAMNVSASRTAISNYVIQNFGDYSALRYDKENNALPPFGWRSEYYPRWVPDGYQISSVNFDHPGDYIWYINDAGKKIEFCVLNFANRPLVNSEDRQGEEIVINGRQAFLYVSEDMRQAALVLPLSNVLLKIEGTLPDNQLIQIAESIEFE